MFSPFSHRFNMPQLQHLKSPAALSDFKNMCMRSHYEMAMRYLNDRHLIAVGAYSNSVPAGLLLGAIESKHIAAIRSVYVEPDFRRQGIATALIHQASLAVEADGIEAISLGVYLPSESTAIRQVIGKCNWKTNPRRLKLLTAMCQNDIGLRNAPWRRQRVDHDLIEVFPWHEISDRELQRLLAISKTEDCWFPSKLSPLVDNTHLYRPLSIGLRYKGELIGWSIAHRFLEGPINFSIMFARKIPEYPLAGFHLLQATADLLVKHADEYPPALLQCAIVDGNKFFGFMQRKVFDFLQTKVQEMDVYCREFRQQEPIATLSVAAW